MCSESGCTPRWETGSALDGITSAVSGDKSQSKEEVQYGDEEQARAEIAEIRRLLLLLRSGAASDAASDASYAASEYHSIFM